MPIAGLTEQLSLPRKGKIRLGIIKENASGKKYPAETSYFVVPEEVAAVYGPEPVSLDVVLPVDDPEQVFPHYLKWYGAGSGLKCRGDGTTAFRPYNLVDDTTDIEVPEDKHDWVEIPCSCYRLNNNDPKDTQNQCGPVGNLMVILPKVNPLATYQLDIRSATSIRGINSVMQMLRAQLGRIAGIPLLLRRVPTEMTHQGQKRTHYLPQLECNLTAHQVDLLRSHPNLLATAIEGQEYEALSEPETGPEAVGIVETATPSWIESDGGKKMVEKARAYVAELKGLVGVEKTKMVVSGILSNAGPFDLEPPYSTFDDPRMGEKDLSDICSRLHDTIESEKVPADNGAQSEMAMQVDEQPD